VKVAASPPFEAVRIGIRFAFQDIRSDFADQRSELEGVAAAAGAHQQPGMFRILADPEIPIEGIAVEADPLVNLRRLRQVGEVSASSTFLAMNSLDLGFGVGRATQIREKARAETPFE